jgi:hypothetical protein
LFKRLILPAAGFWELRNISSQILKAHSIKIVELLETEHPLSISPSQEGEK